MEATGVEVNPSDAPPQGEGPIKAAEVVELEDHPFFKGQRLGHEARQGLAELGLRRVIDRPVAIEPHQLQHEELWIR